MEWLNFLISVNDVLTASVTATAFALMLYLFFYNRDSRVAMSLNGLLLCVIIVYLVDILLTDSYDPHVNDTLLRLQWLGIAFTPALYLEFSRAIRLSVQEDNVPRWLRFGALAVGTVVVGLALFTDLIVHNGVSVARALYLQPGPLFYPFAFLFALVTLWGWRETNVARRHCQTSAAQRRMAYLSLGFLAPALGVFPYLLIIGWPAVLPGVLLWVVLIVGNVAIAVMLTLMAYSVAFIGALTPERVIKHRLVRFLLRGPVTALLALSAFGVGLVLEQRWGLGRYSLSLVATAMVIILAQLAVERSKPLLDLALYRAGQEEVAQIQELSQRLLTTADLRQFLENLLAAMCELVSSRGGFIATLQEDHLHREIWCGHHISPEEIADFPIPEAAKTLRQDGFLIWNDYWIAPIRDKSGKHLLGLLGLRAPQATLPLPPAKEAQLEQLLDQAGVALNDRRLQQFVFTAITPLLDELGEIQRLRGALRQEEPGKSISQIEPEDIAEEIHDALSHYWGGPRLTENPLLEFQVVRQAIPEYDHNPIKALRAVLFEGIERLRPDGERKLTAPEWLLYNILEMKFLRGQKVREVAMQLAVSESDLYRKQRIAIENLARIIVDMETQARENHA
ncbi:MAG: hypothetical protein ACP5HM_04865 [Anaerolineae bacterium]